MAVVGSYKWAVVVAAVDYSSNRLGCDLLPSYFAVVAAAFVVDVVNGDAVAVVVAAAGRSSGN